LNASEAISIREYARQRGCSDTAVRKAVDSGKIVRGIIDQHTKRPKILPSIADVEWSSYTNPNYARVSKSGGNAPPVPPSAPIVDVSEEEPSAPPARTGGKSLAEIKRLTAEVRLQAEAIELKKKKGELVDKKAVYNALFAMGRELKNNIMNIPDRYIDAILAAPTRNDAHTVLTNALIEALETMTEMQNREITT
jgi:hypothetical protein